MTLSRTSGSLSAPLAGPSAAALRPPRRSLVLRALIHGLHVLPWPLGEDVMAGLGVVRGVVRPRRLRRALAWAGRHRADTRGRLGLALRLLANDGRFEATKAFLGLRHPDQLRRHLRVDGVEHLAEASARGATLVLGLHLGPGGVWTSLRVSGFRVAPFVAREFKILELGSAWQPVLDMADVTSVLGASAEARMLGLYRARRLLVDGAIVFIAIDGRMGPQAFRVDVRGATVAIRSGWLALRRQTRAATLPATVHLEGRTRVVTIHPPLPPPDDDAERDAAACKEILTRLYDGYAGRFPAQCRSLVLGSTAPPTFR